MYALPRTFPTVPARRPSIESAAKIEIRALRSVGVMAAVVPPAGAGWPVLASGGRAPPHDHRAGRSVSAISRESRIGGSAGGREEDGQPPPTTSGDPVS